MEENECWTDAALMLWDTTLPSQSLRRTTFPARLREGGLLLAAFL